MKPQKTSPLDLPFFTWTDLRAYVSHINTFSPWDWICYLAWVGCLFSLFIGVSTFLYVGVRAGIVFPDYVWFIPFGALVFSTALALDTIGHRTIYKEDLARGEMHVHHMIIATAVPSVVALCLGHSHPETLRMPIIGLIFLSFFYSGIDEMLHWKRYLEKGVDRVETWSHFFAILGHVLLIGAWWQWYASGYQGVSETIALLSW